MRAENIGSVLESLEKLLYQLAKRIERAEERFAVLQREIALLWERLVPLPLRETFRPLGLFVMARVTRSRSLDPTPAPDKRR